jgi:hypothetical protein
LRDLFQNQLYVLDFSKNFQDFKQIQKKTQSR